MHVRSTAPEISSLLTELKHLRESCLAMEKEFGASIAEACPESRSSVQNLLHAPADCIDFETGPAILGKQAAQLLGPVPEGRAVRVMVTMPSEAAQSYELVKSLLDAGMDVMRVNCAHDSESEWESMIAHLRRATEESGKHCKVQMDLAGPKLRTGPLPHGHHVVRWKVDSDGRGKVVGLAHITLAGKHASPESLSSAEALLPVPEAFLRAVRVGDTVRIKDSNKKKRRLMVIKIAEHSCVCTWIV